MSSCSDNETLLDLVVRGRWSALVSRADTHAEELAAVGEEDGMTVFQWACVNDAPPQTLKALLVRDKHHASRGNPRAVLIADVNGTTPLMSACVRGSFEHVSLLIESAPEAIPMVDNDGWTALHYLCHYSRAHYIFGERVLPLLLSQSQAKNRQVAFQKDSRPGNNTPISLTCDTFGITQDSLREESFRGERDPVFCFRFVARLLDLVLPPERRSWPLMSRLLSFSEIPLVFVDLVLLLRAGDSVLQVNDDGDTALHIAASKPWKTGLVKRVVKACPRAASVRNRRGLLPLQLALTTLNRHWNEDILALVDAYPASLEALELDDGVYPYILDRISCAPDTVYRLIRSKPTLVRTRIE